MVLSFLTWTTVMHFGRITAAESFCESFTYVSVFTVAPLLLYVFFFMFYLLLRNYLLFTWRFMFWLLLLLSFAFASVFMANAVCFFLEKALSNLFK